MTFLVSIGARLLALRSVIRSGGCPRSNASASCSGKLTENFCSLFVIFRILNGFAEANRAEQSPLLKLDRED